MTTHGTFVWHDLMTTNPQAAQTFYSHVAGFGTLPFEGADPPYTMFTVGGAPVGGVAQMDEGLRVAGVPPHWIPYVGVTDINGSAQQIAQLGGTIIVPVTEIPTIGHFAIAQDPQGATLAIYTSSNAQEQHSGPPRVGDVSWMELVTSDHTAAFNNFYSKLFQWKKLGEFDMGPLGQYLMYGQGDKTYGGMMTKSPDMSSPPAWITYFHVKDVPQSVAVINKSGGKVVNGPEEVPGGDMVAQAIDPQGGFFAIHAKARVTVE